LTAGQNHILCRCDGMAVIHPDVNRLSSYEPGMALRQVDDQRLVEPFAGVGTSVEQ
jgi:hypothetical protein